MNKPFMGIVGHAGLADMSKDARPPSLRARLNPAIFALPILLLSGCASAPVTTTALLPIAVKPESPGLIEKPYLPILDVPRETIEACENTGDLCGDLVKALDASLEAAMAWGLQQEIVLDGYRKSVIK